MGLKILDAILLGERGPLTLARLCHGGVKNSKETIAKSLEGDYRPEHLFLGLFFGTVCCGFLADLDLGWSAARVSRMPFRAE